MAASVMTLALNISDAGMVFTLLSGGITDSKMEER
jgi:hypothetical protein